MGDWAGALLGAVQGQGSLLVVGGWFFEWVLFAVLVPDADGAVWVVSEESGCCGAVVVDPFFGPVVEFDGFGDGVAVG